MAHGCGRRRACEGAYAGEGTFWPRRDAGGGDARTDADVCGQRESRKPVARGNEPVRGGARACVGAALCRSGTPAIDLPRESRRRRDADEVG